MSSRYRYELRRGEEIAATGHLTIEVPLEVGQTLRIGDQEGIVKTIEPLLANSELRVVVELDTKAGPMAGKQA